MSKVKYSIGIDLGGTKIAASLVRNDGVIVDYLRTPVNSNENNHSQIKPDNVVSKIKNLILEINSNYPSECSGRNFMGIGLASAGPLNVNSGELIYPANFPGWKIVPIRDLLQKKLKEIKINKRVNFQNDAMASALAEGWIGGAKKLNSYAVVTLGTGIGTGVIVNGQPCQTHGVGSEFGHLVINSGSFAKKDKNFKSMTVEGIASGPALVKKARSMGFKGHSVEELIKDDKKKYHKIYNEMSWALACLCFNLSIGIGLEGIFISGGLLNIKKYFYKDIVTNYKYLINQFNSSFECPIRIANTKNKAGVIGAAYLPYIK
ncbi:MAG: ROK family protein [Bdellovibrionales bacterium]|nr:ROK family protein [Bdellovibrionales bacterium]